MKLTTAYDIRFSFERLHRRVLGAVLLEAKDILDAAGSTPSQINWAKRAYAFPVQVSEEVLGYVAGVARVANPIETSSDESTVTDGDIRTAVAAAVTKLV